MPAFMFVKPLDATLTLPQPPPFQKEEKSEKKSYLQKEEEEEEKIRLKKKRTRDFTLYETKKSEKERKEWIFQVFLLLLLLLQLPWAPEISFSSFFGTVELRFGEAYVCLWSPKFVSKWSLYVQYQTGNHNNLYCMAELVQTKFATHWSPAVRTTRPDITSRHCTCICDIF